MATYLITGASRGIGREFCRQLTGRGERVIATVRGARAAELGELAAKVVELDVTDSGAVGRLAELVGEPVDVLVNNAGVSSPSPALAETTAEELARVFAVNSTAPVMVAKSVLPLMDRAGRKLIVNISTQLASIALNSGGSSYGYRASKTALNMLTVCMAHELGKKGFTCVALHPGWVKTDMGGEKAPLTPGQSVASMVALLDRLTPADSGRFLNYDGAPLAW